MYFEKELKALFKKYNASINLTSETCCGWTDHSSYEININWHENGEEFDRNSNIGFDETDFLGG